MTQLISILPRAHIAIESPVHGTVNMGVRVSAVLRILAATKIFPTNAGWWWCGRASPQSSRAISHLRDDTRSKNNNHRRRFYTSAFGQIRNSIMASDPALDKILAGKYPAKKHAENVARYIRDAHPEITDGLIYLESTKSSLLEDSDSEGGFSLILPFSFLQLPYSLSLGSCCPRYTTL